MLHSKLGNKVLVSLLLIALLGLLLISPTLQAQGSGVSLRITAVDTSAFPQVKVSIFGEGLQGGLDNAEIQLEEDGQRRQIISDETEDIGVQVAIVVDASSNILAPGATGRSRLDEAAFAVNDLIRSRRLLEGKDYLSAIAFGRENNKPVPQVLAPWSQDYQDVINQVLLMRPDPANQKTPLIQQIFFALEQFKNANVPSNLQRHIVVFSDGIDLLSGTQPEDLPRIANQLNVRVHTVWFRNNVREAGANMRRIAAITGGQTFTISASEPIPINIWETIQASQRQRVIVYRSDNPNPQQVSVSAIDVSGDRQEAQSFVPPLRILPAHVLVLKPGSQPITRKGASWNTPVTELDPTTISGQIEITWPDGHGRIVEDVEFSIDGKVLEGMETTREGNRLGVVLPIADLDQGRHTLRVRVTDELGLTAESEPVSLGIIVDKPPPPPTPNMDATADAREAEMRATADARTTVQAMEVATAAVAAEAKMRATADARATVQAMEVATAAVAAEAEMRATADARATVQAMEVATAAVAAEAKIAAQATETARKQESTMARIQETAEDWQTRFRSLSYVSIASGAFGLIALIFAIVAWRSPRVRKRATEIVGGTIQAVTEPFMGARDGGPPTTEALARLILVAGGASASQSIDIYKEVTKIGRDITLADVILTDRRVSRYHAQIVQEKDGFRLYDEGSTSGTWVNDRQVSMQGHLLSSGDEINFGPVRYRFVLVETENATLVGHPEDVGEPTQIYVPAADAPTQIDFDDATQIDRSYVNPSDFDSTQYMESGDDDESDRTKRGSRI
ncbi:MAG: FHA domain-containing protein [Nitrospirae bacterium]|nr:MAG: FHA domain-containing protein [Nitrospirota bacterium]